MLSLCGLICTECPAYLAARTDDGELRAKTAKAWSKMFKVRIKPEEIDCDGCSSEGERLFSHCRVCEVRQCARERGLLNCYVCLDYPCARIARLHQYLPEAKKTLERFGIDSKLD